MVAATGGQASFHHRREIHRTFPSESRTWPDNLMRLTDTARLHGDEEAFLDTRDPGTKARHSYAVNLDYACQEVRRAGPKPRRLPRPTSLLRRRGIQSTAQPPSVLHCSSAKRKRGPTSAILTRIRHAATFASFAVQPACPQPVPTAFGKRSMAANGAAASTQLCASAHTFLGHACIQLAWSHSKQRADGLDANESAAQLLLSLVAESRQHHQSDGCDTACARSINSLRNGRSLGYSKPYAGAQPRRSDTRVGAETIGSCKDVVACQRQLSSIGVSARASRARGHGRSGVDDARSLRAATNGASARSFAYTFCRWNALSDATWNRIFAQSCRPAARLSTGTERIRPAYT
jgi:hypothetical protein